MPKSKKVDGSNYFNLPNPGLRSYFDIVLKGQSDVYHTPWIHVKDESDSEAILKQLSNIMNEWLPHLDTLQNEWPTLWKFEKDLAAKVGPMSVMKPLSERISDIEDYYTGIHLPAESLDARAIKATVAKFAKARGLTPRSQSRTVELMKRSTNSGNPYFAKRKTVTDKTVPCSASLAGQSLNGKEWPITAVLGWRGQEGGPKVEDVKQRVVWMFPYAVNIRELQVYQPLIEVFQNFEMVPAWVSMESVDRAITRMFDTKGDDYVVCTDFTKFDQHFNEQLQDAAKAILTAILDGSKESREWIEQVYPIKFEIPLSDQINSIWTGKHGMGSGSGGTNADETLAHTALQFEAAQRVGVLLNPNSQCLGDDGVLTYPGITVEDVVRSYSAHGLEMNAEKQEVSKHDCTYLRRWHHQNYRVNGVCVGVYATTRALGRLCMQERYYAPDDWSMKMVALRELSIIENVKYHPLREEFADFCMKKDKYRLGLDIPGFLDNVDRIAKDAIELMPDFLGYTKSMIKDQTGLSDWWIVKYLKSKM